MVTKTFNFYWYFRGHILYLVLNFVIIIFSVTNFIDIFLEY